MDRYKDLELKKEYFEKKAEKEMIEKQDYGTLIKSKVAQINLFLSIFKHNEQFEQESFDVYKYNQGIQEIKKDLEIIEEIIEKTLIPDTRSLLAFLDAEIKWLNKRLEEYRNKHQLESDGFYMGETLAYQDKDFVFIKEDNMRKALIEKVKVNTGDSLSLFVEGFTEDPESFSGEILIDDEVYYIDNFLYSQKRFDITTKESQKLFPFTINKELKTKENKFEIVLEDEEIDLESDHMVFGGINSLLSANIKRGSMYKEYNSPTMIEINGLTEFYIIGGSYLEMHTNRKPLYSTHPFNQENKINKFAEKIQIEHNQNFPLEINTDGKICATKIKHKKEDNSLYITDTFFDEYFLIEMKKGEEIEIDVKIINSKKDIAPNNLKYIALKRD